MHEEQQHGQNNKHFEHHHPLGCHFSCFQCIALSSIPKRRDLTLDTINAISFTDQPPCPSWQHRPEGRKHASSSPTRCHTTQ